MDSWKEQFDQMLKDYRIDTLPDVFNKIQQDLVVPTYKKIVKYLEHKYTIEAIVKNGAIEFRFVDYPVMRISILLEDGVKLKIEQFSHFETFLDPSPEKTPCSVTYKDIASLGSFTEDDIAMVVCHELKLALEEWKNPKNIDFNKVEKKLFE